MPGVAGTQGDDTFVVVEKWASLAALQAHAAAPHMKAYAASVKDLMAKRVINGRRAYTGRSKRHTAHRA